MFQNYSSKIMLGIYRYSVKCLVSYNMHSCVRYVLKLCIEYYSNVQKVSVAFALHGVCMLCIFN